MSVITKLRHQARSICRTRIAFFAVIASFFQALLQIFLESVIIHFHFSEMRQSEENSGVKELLIIRALGNALAVYFIIFIVTSAFQLYITLDSLYYRSSVNLIALCIINLGLFSYSVMQYFQSQNFFLRIEKTLKTSLTLTSWAHIPTMVVSAFFLLAIIIISFLLPKFYNWDIYKKLGADSRLRKQLFYYSTLSMLIKVDFLFYMALGLQFAFVTFETNLEWDTAREVFIVSSYTVWIAFIMFYVCRHGLKRESRRWMWLFIVTAVFTLCFLSFFIYEVHTNSEKSYFLVGCSMYLSLAFSMTLILATIINAFICMQHFGKGLKAHLSKPQPIAPKKLGLESENSTVQFSVGDGTMV